MMRIAPAAKAFVFARASFPMQRNVAFTALRMMGTAAPSIKVSQSHGPILWVHVACHCCVTMTNKELSENE